MVSVLTIAGSDPSGGAGIEADLSVFAALGIHGRTAITALTAQSYLPFVRGGRREAAGGVDHFSTPPNPPLSPPGTLRRGGMYPTSPDTLQKILHLQDHDTLPDAIKIGMIGTLANLNVICDFLERHPQIPVVLDPVLRATSGLELLEVAAIPMLKERLWPRATVVTPNLDEAGILLGHRPTTVEEMESAARELQRGSQIVVVKGGHLEGNPVDVVWNGKEMCHLRSARVNSQNLRGTGCRLASAIAVYLARGDAPIPAIQYAKSFLVQMLNNCNHLKIKKKD